MSFAEQNMGNLFIDSYKSRFKSVLYSIENDLSL